MNNKLICPFCQRKLKTFAKYKDGTSTVYCSKCNLFGDSKLFLELIRTRKALDVAKEGLKEIQDKGEYVNPIELAESYLDEITTLEQKDVK